MGAGRTADLRLEVPAGKDGACQTQRGRHLAGQTGRWPPALPGAGGWRAGGPCLWALPAGRRTRRTGGSHRGRSAEQPPLVTPWCHCQKVPGRGSPRVSLSPRLGAYGTGGISHGSEGRVSEVKAWAGSVTGDHDFQFTDASSWCPLVARGRGRALGGPFDLRALTPLPKTPPLLPVPRGPGSDR